MKELYNARVIPSLMEKYVYKSVMQVPKLCKVVINIGEGEAKGGAKVLENALGDLAIISGQRPVVTVAKKSVASFKVREGMKIGCKVTLRGMRMYIFLQKLFAVGLPRVRDFKGLDPNSFDGRGNYALGIKEQLVFPEIKYDEIDKIRGMDVVIVTTAKTDEEAKQLLVLLGAPFPKDS